MTTLTATEDHAGKVLAHFGRLGMRWGVRRSPEQLASDPVGKNSAADPDAIRAVQTQAKIKAAGSLNVVSSKDLSDLVKRMELESKYVKQTLESKPQTKKGEGFIKKLIKNETDSYFLKGKKGPLTTVLDNLLNPKDAKTPTQATKKAGSVAANIIKNKGAKKAPKNSPVYKVTSLG